MTETIDNSAAAAEARAEQARLARKERREAKIRAGGTSRLNKISGVGGGLQRSDGMLSLLTIALYLTGLDWIGLGWAGFADMMVVV